MAKSSTQIWILKAVSFAKLFLCREDVREDPKFLSLWTILDPEYCEEQHLLYLNADVLFLFFRTQLFTSLQEPENVREAEAYDMPCTACLTYAITRLAQPCRHRLYCSSCALRAVTVRSSYEDGSYMPVTCGRCRALIASFEKFY